MDMPENVLQNLRDAGCSEPLIHQCRQLWTEPMMESARNRRQMQLLSAYRKELLAKLHEDQRRLSCLDFLLYQVREHAAQMPGE